MPSTLDKTRKELALVLQKEPNNFNKIIELSMEIAQFDDMNVRFTIDAGVIDRLGKELVSKPETAVSELTKNAYDADATDVTLTFEDSVKIGGTLTIEDNGVGMTRDQLINGFMRISSTEKIHFPVSSKFERRRAGRKGIGRFATQRLGEKLTIITQTIEDDQAIKLEIDWSKFKIDKNLQSISSKIEQIKKIKDEGTTLIIKDLRDAWSDSSLKRAYRYVSDLLQPYPLSKGNKKYIKEREGIDPGFKAIVYRKEGNVLTPIADDESMFTNYAIATIEGYIDKGGIGICSINSSQLDIDNELFEVRKLVETKNGQEKQVPYKTLSDAHFKCFYFIYNYLPKQNSTSIRKTLAEHGGMKLYRNGFRVPSIGEHKDDWLGFDISVRRRSILPPHGNNNFTGFVEVTDFEGIRFDETSNRENLAENESFSDLKDFVYRAVITGVLRVSEARGTKDKTNKVDYKTPTQKLEGAINGIDNIADEFEGKGDARIAHTIRQISAEMRDAVSLQREVDFDVLNEISMLRVLSSLGLTIGEFTHEIKNYIRSIVDDADYFVEKYKGRTEDSKTAKRLKANIISFSSYASYFDETISQNVNRSTRPLALDVELMQFVELIRPALGRTNIELIGPEMDSFGLYTCPIHPSEFKSILFNFFTNSRKAILKSDNQGRIFLKAGIVKGSVYFDFNDNGIGISDDIKERVFEAFFTTSSPVGHLESERKELTGSGLGLKIVKDIVASYSGTVKLSNPAKGYKTCFRVEFPKASNKTLKEYGIDY